MNKAELQETIALSLKDSDIKKADILTVIDATFDTIKATLGDVKCITVRGFGNFEVTHSAPRTARNPRTGEPVDVPAKNKIKFKPAQAFQDKLN